MIKKLNLTKFTMTLPPYDPSIYWKDYSIETPTLELRPFEKSDMSPFLVHMTGRQQIESILQSKCINASVPSQSTSDWYDEKVVCFTETPIFCIDSFRYINFKRWEADQRYGIGFSKKALADKGVRPALYVDDDTIRLIADLKGNEIESKLGKIYYKFAPLMTPLHHDKDKQGFMWEREWRFSNVTGFNFDYSDIKIICCPKNEMETLASILGQHTNHISFVETWGEYEEVSKYLESRRHSLEMKLVVNSNGVDELKTARSKLSKELLNLDAFKNQLHRFVRELDAIELAIPEIQGKIDDIESKLEERKVWLESYCCICSNSFDEYDLTPHKWEPDGDFDTWICIDCKLKIGC